MSEIVTVELPEDRSWYMQYFPGTGYRVQINPRGREWCTSPKQTEFDSRGNGGFKPTLQEAYDDALRDALTRALEGGE